MFLRNIGSSYSHTVQCPRRHLSWQMIVPELDGKMCFFSGQWRHKLRS
jgi:hypothetical protein